MRGQWTRRVVARIVATMVARKKATVDRTLEDIESLHESDTGVAAIETAEDLADPVGQQPALSTSQEKPSAVRWEGGQRKDPDLKRSWVQCAPSPYTSAAPGELNYWVQTSAALRAGPGPCMPRRQRRR
jgi:hypothetical protein